MTPPTSSRGVERAELPAEWQVESLHAVCATLKRPLRIVRGSGAVLVDEAGRHYIDCTAGIGVASVGHANPRVTRAIALQAERLLSCPDVFYNDTRAAYVERLVAALPDTLERVFLCNSGTESVEAALKFARHATGRTEIVAALRGFHGRTMGALSATWEPRYRAPFEPLVPGFSHVRYNDLAALEQAVTDQTAAVLLEVVQGEGGVRLADPHYLQAARHLCDARGALLILDEVQTGFGRTGRLWACEHSGVVPDVLCLAKGIASGVPMAATCVGPRVPSLPPGAHSSTFGGNPLACAAALATLEELRERRLPEHAAEMGDELLTRLRSVATRAPVVREVRGVGLMIGIELRERAHPFLERLAERGVLALTAGPQVIRLLPPLVIEREQIVAIAAALEEVLQ